VTFYLSLSIFVIFVGIYGLMLKKDFLSKMLIIHLIYSGLFLMFLTVQNITSSKEIYIFLVILLILPFSMIPVGALLLLKLSKENKSIFEKDYELREG